jgi:hypothetical protein
VRDGVASGYSLSATLSSLAADWPDIAQDLGVATGDSGALGIAQDLGVATGDSGALGARVTDWPSLTPCLRTVVRLGRRLCPRTLLFGA